MNIEQTRAALERAAAHATNYRYPGPPEDAAIFRALSAALGLATVAYSAFPMIDPISEPIVMWRSDNSPDMVSLLPVLIVPIEEEK